MIKREFYRTREDGINLYRTYSDDNFKIIKVGTEEIYDEAIDVEDSSYTYEETTTPIEIDINEIKAQAYDILTGGVE
jgi:hypothetical protein